MTSTSTEPRQIILDAIAHLDHVLPGQAPIHDFVHHNTLHGFQHLPFEQALSEFTALTGIACYQSAEQFRDFYRQGRITDRDLDAALQQRFGTDLDENLGDIDRRQLYRAALLHDLSAISPAQLAWQRDAGELDDELWPALLAKLELPPPELHPEDLLDLSAEQAESWLSGANAAHFHDHGATLSDQLFDSIGDELSLRGLLLALTGYDILDSVRPQLIRLCASLLDEGLAAWRLPGREALGLYQAWRQSRHYHTQAYLADLHGWESITAALPDDAVDAIAQQLEALALPLDRWDSYLRRLALEIPGWSGLINWRQTHPAYHADDATQPSLADYLALRLILDRAHAQVLCRTLWRCPARLDQLRAYFRKHGDEFFVRHSLFQADLPEYLAQAGQSLLADNARTPRDWRRLAERIWTWQHSPLANEGQRITAHHHAWRLYCLCRALHIDSNTLSRLDKSRLLNWLELIADFERKHADYLWLCAYEHHYRENLLQALHANRGRGRWARRDQRPQAQVFFCMDEREESFRRHLEECNPAIETLGAAGFFGVAMNYKGLDDHEVTPLCPVVVTPAHQVDEAPQPGQESQLEAHRRGLRRATKLSYWLYQNSRRDPFSAYVGAFLLAPLKLWRLLMKHLAPTWQRWLEQRWQAALVTPVPTELRFSAADPSHPSSPEAPRLGFSDQEQADRVAGFLKTTGLTYGFAPIVAILGHGSTSQNNPHEAAHDCGACGGRRGGPNARVFAAMANRPEVRALLAERGIAIPADTWFIGALHDTCSDVVTWYDLDAIPEARRNDFTQLRRDVLAADALAAAERCRRFASSGYPDSAPAAICHVENRAADLSQVRPEFGHATNAAAFIGRRSASQGVFFDRRLFLISYDPTQDPEGAILENILLTAGPVGAGINLEYYFSTVNNDRLGCGTKIPHNVTGLFGVMEGAGSDLRTGLPLQMVEIHEAMRLQIVVENKPSVLETIYARQPALQELVGGGWVHLNCLDPDSGEIFVFERGLGFVRWRPESVELPLRDDSIACYRGSTQAVPPILIKQAELVGGRG